MLSRRIPLIQAPPPQPPAKSPASALPLHLQRSSIAGTGTPPRVSSPQLSQRPMTPPIGGPGPAPYRPGSPFRARTNTIMSLPNRPHSPNLPPTPNTAVRRPDETIDADLIVRYLPRDDVVAQKPFKVDFTVSLAAPVPPARPGQPRKQRILSLAIQHVQPAPPPVPAAVSPPHTSNTDVWSPRISSGFSTPSPYATPYRADFPDSLAQRLLVASPRETLVELDLESNADTDGRDTAGETPAAHAARYENIAVLLPPPFANSESDGSGPRSKDVVFVGPSAIMLPPLHLSAPATTEGVAPGHERTDSESTTDSEADSDLHETIGGSIVRAIASQDFELEFLPLKSGFATVGGLRVLLVEDRLVDIEEDASEARSNRFSEARTLQEWDVVAEVWVKSAVESLL